MNVLPSVTKKTKEVEDNSPRKDDAKDAGQICKLLASGFFVTFVQLDEVVAEMRVLTTERERLTRERTRLKNRLQALLDVAWPEFVGHFCNVAKPTPRALLRRWPLPQDLLAARPSTVETEAHAVSRGQVKAAHVAAILASARHTIAIATGAAGRRAEILRLLDRWALLDKHLAHIDHRLTALVAEHAGATALTTVPGVSVVCAATLVAEVGTPDTFQSPRQVLKLAGMNLATKHESGISLRGRAKQTKRGRPALRRQLFLLAGRWCAKRGLYHETYRALTARNGNSQIKAMCAVARKLVPMLLVIMQTGRPFDAATWRANRLERPDQAA